MKYHVAVNMARGIGGPDVLVVAARTAYFTHPTFIASDPSRPKVFEGNLGTCRVLRDSFNSGPGVFIIDAKGRRVE